MASIDNGAATPGYEPCARYGHALVAYKGCTYAVGGWDSASKLIDPTLVDVFKNATLKWQQHRATGRHSLNLHWGELERAPPSVKRQLHTCVCSYGCQRIP